MLIVLIIIGLLTMYIFSQHEEITILSEAEIVDLIENIVSAGTMAEAIHYYNSKGEFQDDRITEAFNNKMAEFTPRLCFS